MPSTIHAAWMHMPDSESGSHLFIWAEDIEFTTRTTRARSTESRIEATAHPSTVRPEITPADVASHMGHAHAGGRADARDASNRVRGTKIPSHPEQLPIGSLRALLYELAPGLANPGSFTGSANGHAASSEPASRPGFAAGSATGTEASAIDPGAQQATASGDGGHETLQETLQPANAVVWLPTIDDAPALRRSLIHTTQPRSDGVALEPVLYPWQVTGVRLSPLRALLFLAHLSPAMLRQQAVERPGLHRLRLGNDLLFWSNAAKFALEVLVGQHYLPSLRAEPTGRLNTVWQPFLSDPWVEERRARLAQNMPPICRAYNLQNPEAAPAPVTLTEDFVATVVDAAVRAWGREPAAMSVAGQANPTSTWLQALLSTSGTLQLPPQPAHDLFQSWSQWVEQLYIVRDANFRICFVLEEPQDAQESAQDDSTRDDTARDDTARDDLSGSEASTLGTWTLRFYLQARDNSSLMIPAAEVWQASNNVLQAGNRHIDQPQERLLAGLGVAGRLFPPLARSMRQSRPEHCALSTREAYEFLREIAPLLESSGFGVIVPNWWNAERRVRLGLRLSFHSDEDEFAQAAQADFGPEAEDGLADEIPFDPDDSAMMGGRSEDRADGQGRGRTGAARSAAGAAASDAQKETAGVPAHLGLNSLVNYSWELTLGGADLSTSEFEQLTASNTPLLRLRGQWVELDPEQVDATYRFLAGRPAQGKTTLLQAIRVAQSLADDAALQATGEADLAGDSDSGAGVPAAGPDLDAVFAHADGPANTDDSLQAANLTVDSVAVHGWLDRVLEQLRTHEPPKPIPAPPGFKGQLRPYQERGVGWLAHLCSLGLGGCLADDMGLGKTIQAIALILHEQLEAEAAGETLPPTLLICPTSVVANWRREIERFAPGLRAMVHHGNNRASGDAFFTTLAEHDLLVTSYGTARRDIETLTQIQWNDLILDEAQNIKTPSAKQTQAVRRLQGRNRMALTGTPVENRLSELWSIMEFLNPGYLGNHEAFRRRFIIPIERYSDSERTAELRRLVQPFLLRRLKSDPTIISDLPEKNEMVVYCSLTREQAELYEKIVNEALAALRRADGIQRRGLVLALLTKLKQITNHPAHFLKEDKPLEGRSGKLSRLTEMLDEAISVGDRALIFTQFVEMGTLLQRHLTGTLGTETLFLHGGTPANQRDKMVQAFQSEEGPPVFVLSLRAGGSGLNLTQANHVFHYDRWWNPAVENQATDRAFRIGQRRDVQVHKFVVAGTLEERIHDLIENKQALAQSIVGSGEDWLTELETDELRELLMLRQDAIEDE